MAVSPLTATAEIPPDEIRQTVITLYAHEQSWFWSRFTAFSAMNAGLFVIVSQSDNVTRTILIIGAVVLSALWSYIQCISLWYVQRYKEAFHRIREEMGITHTIRVPIDRAPLSSTAAGAAVSVIITLLWLALAHVPPAIMSATASAQTGAVSAEP